jgi:hypothetical protein
VSRRVLAVTVVSILSACDRAPVPEPTSDPSAVASSPAPLAVATSSPVITLSSRLSRPAAPRVVAIGDLHGDLDSARRALRLAGAIDPKGAWSGGALVVVQTGDEIDRRDDDRAVLDLIESLKASAAAAGGAVIALLGNHEVMNAEADFRYVTPGGFASFSAFADASPTAGREAAFRPGARYAALLAGRPLLEKVGDTVFVHGGVLPKHVRYGLDKMNDEVDAWLDGLRPQPPAPLLAEDGPLWTRVYSDPSAAPHCNDLAEVLGEMGARRMVVGHTVQEGGISSACDGRVWRIDVGMSRAFGGPIEVLQIAGDELTVLHEGDAGRSR